VHDGMRGKDAYSLTEKGIFNSLSYGVPLGVSTTLTKLNCGHILEIYGFLKKNNISRWIIEKLKPVGRAVESNICMSAKDDECVMKLLSRLKAEDYDVDISIYDCANNCSAGIKTISVNPNGDVTPCAFMPHAVCGNILTDSWGAITEKIGGLRLKGITCF
ncbi:MAG: radical SAM protein, partial [Candidatus Aenigmarchaeota archaeon]|nr:radical SAM protein [Candidatus Aenigmarchaeota archaeon]